MSVAETFAWAISVGLVIAIVLMVMGIGFGGVQPNGDVRIHYLSVALNNTTGNGITCDDTCIQTWAAIIGVGIGAISLLILILYWKREKNVDRERHYEIHSFRSKGSRPRYDHDSVK